MRSTFIILLLFIGLIGGWGSALYAVDAGGSLASAQDGWRRWDTSATDRGGVYAVAHYLLRGAVPPPDALFQSYYADVDGEGGALDGDCAYIIEMPPIAARWWSFSAGPETPSPREAAATITSDGALSRKDGSLAIVIAPNPMPGNWLKPPGRGEIVVRLLIASDRAQPQLPKIRRVSC
jgi:hypothetical protein